MAAGPSSLEQDVIEGENPVRGRQGLYRVKLLRRVELFGNAALNGR